MKYFVLAVFVGMIGHAGAAEFSHIEKLPIIKNHAEFARFVEQGILCKNKWAMSALFKHPYQVDVNLNELKELDVMLKKIGFKTEFTFKDEYRYYLKVDLKDHHNFRVHGFSVDSVFIGMEYGVYFTSILNSSSKYVIGKLRELKLHEYPFQHTQGGDGDLFFALDPESTLYSIKVGYGESMTDIGCVWLDD